MGIDIENAEVNDATGRLLLVLPKPVLLRCHSVLRIHPQRSRSHPKPLVSGEEIMSMRKNCFHGYVHELENHSPGVSIGPGSDGDGMGSGAPTFTT